MFCHSIQAKDTLAAGAEFLLIFDNGSFSEDDTFLLTVCNFLCGWTIAHRSSGLAGSCSQGSYCKELPDGHLSL